MLALVLDSATPAITAALAHVTATAVVLRATRITVDARAHGELLAPAIEAALADAGVKPADLAAVVAGVGPGPFTGLRVGLVTATVLADVLGIPAYPVCSLDGLGRRTGPGLVLVATDARRREVYWARYRDGVRVTEPAVDKPADLDCTGVGYAVGDGALLHAAALPVPVRDTPRYPEALALAELAAHRVRTGAPGEPLTPLYLRRPDAVAQPVRKPALP